MPRPALRAVAAAVAFLALPAAAHAAGPGDYTLCAPVPGARFVQVARTTCAAAAPAAAAVAAAPTAGEAQSLVAAGWAPIRAAAAPAGAHDIVALSGRAVLRVRRPGETPDLDGWAAGRELIFSRHTLKGGARIPSDAALCTSAFAVRIHGSPAGLSAGHCAGLTKKNTAKLRNVGLRRPPQAGLVLGSVRRLLNRTAPYDALAVPVLRGDGRTFSPIVDRGIARPPWIVAGAAKPYRGRATCFTGRSSGIDRCGSVAGGRARTVERLLRAQAGVEERCTTIDGIPGDSGGPVYTAPRADGTVRALGLVSLGVGFAGNMCFTPIGPTLDRLGARLATG